MKGACMNCRHVTLGDAGVSNSDLSYTGDPTDPAVYLGASLGNTVRASQVSGESWTDTLSRILPSLVLANSQRQLLAVQMDRARQGLPPLDASQYGLGVSVGVSPEVQRLLLIGGGLLLAGVVLVPLLKRRG